MAVYVDEIQEYPTTLKYKKWCHMIADSDEELHAMAAKIGLKRAWHQTKPHFSHYDLVPSKRAQAVRNGAVELDWRAMAKKMQELRELQVQEGSK